jgi:nicotinamide-nucleotide amidase
MKAEIISIGDELLIGQVINTNASWIGEQLTMAGIKVYQAVSIADDYNHIFEALELAGRRADVVLITGGLGPTKDDITKKTLCDFFGSKPVFNEQVFEDVKEIFRVRGRKVTELNRKQAEVPDNCTVIRNIHGTAPGMWFEKEGKIFVSMPGVPFEMRPMVTDYIIPELQKRFNLPAIFHKTVLTQGVPESEMAAMIEEWENTLPSNVKLAYLPQPGIVRLRLTASGENRDEPVKVVENEIVRLKEIIGEYIFGFDKDTIEEIVGDLLREKGKTVSTAESCTGGYIAHLITSIAGSSDYYKGSVVSYANEIKSKILNVSDEDLEKYGAVSEPVVRQMAEGVREKFGTDYALATSGIAGPAGGTDEKPVGTTWIALATPEKVTAKLYNFGEHRGRNIRRSALMALDMLRKEMKDS